MVKDSTVSNQSTVVEQKETVELLLCASALTALRMPCLTAGTLWQRCKPCVCQMTAPETGTEAMPIYTPRTTRLLGFRASASCLLNQQRIKDHEAAMCDHATP